MLAGEERRRCKLILDLLQIRDLRILHHTVTGMMSQCKREEFLEDILDYTKNILQLLRRKKITKGILFRYLHEQGVRADPDCEKHYLIKCVLSHNAVSDGIDPQDYIKLYKSTQRVVTWKSPMNSHDEKSHNTETPKSLKFCEKSIQASPTTIKSEQAVMKRKHFDQASPKLCKKFPTTQKSQPIKIEAILTKTQKTESTNQEKTHKSVGVKPIKTEPNSPKTKKIEKCARSTKNSPQNFIKNKSSESVFVTVKRETPQDRSFPQTVKIEPLLNTNNIMPVTRLNGHTTKQRNRPPTTTNTHTNSKNFFAETSHGLAKVRASWQIAVHDNRKRPQMSTKCYVRSHSRIPRKYSRDSLGTRIADEDADDWSD